MSDRRILIRTTITYQWQLKRWFLISAIALFATAAQAQEALSPADVREVGPWGSLQNIKQFKHLYLSGQPDNGALAAAKSDGIGVVINLREVSELDWDERAAASTAGLSYYHVPVSGEAASFESETFATITRLVEANRDSGIRIHCASGNRVSAWLAVHLKADHHMELESALAIVRQTGMRKQSIEDKVRAFPRLHATQ